MLDALKTLFENDVVSEEVRAQIEEAWQARVRENRQAATAELREEFAQNMNMIKRQWLKLLMPCLVSALPPKSKSLQMIADN